MQRQNNAENNACIDEYKGSFHSLFR